MEHKSQSITKADHQLWTPEAELALYMSMIGLRPVGIHRNFRLINIYLRLQSRLGSNSSITYADMKAHLESLFDMQLLDEIEDENEEEEEEEDEEEGNDESDDNASGRKVAKKGGERPKSSAYDPTNSSAEGSDKNEEEDQGGESSSSESSNDEEEDGAEENDEDESESSQKEDQDNNSGGGGGGLSITTFIPATSIGATADTSDPQFWRRKNTEFVLPWMDFGTMMVERAGIGVSEDHEDVEASERSASGTSTPAMMMAASTPASAATPMVMSPEPDTAEGDQNQNQNQNQNQADDSDSGKTPPVLRKRKGRSLTPVPRSRPKGSRSSTAATSGPRKRTKGR
ncbi:hypothetical protein IWW48_001722 [Coemansia sp. RSA 1200]|nr:hypothetical protein IWW48_001722 [Coemansia sp. RSA 1200]